MVRHKFFQNPIFWAVTLSLIYWCYLMFSTRMIINCDAVNYEDLGKLLRNSGWLEYFRSGPNREPIYPLLVSVSMGIGDFFSLPYQSVQVFMQFSILFITQLLMLRVLRILNIHEWISACVVLYLGISPAIVNSALSLFSEISTYPMILAIVLLIYKSGLSLLGPKSRVIMLAILTSSLFVLISLDKAAFELMTPFFIILLFILLLLTRKIKIVFNGIVYLTSFFILFYSSITCYKLINKNYNGHFAITNRGAEGIYGLTSRRVEPLTYEKFLIALAYVPGEGVCRSIFGEDKCFFWSWKNNNFYPRKELIGNNMSSEAYEKTLIRLSIKKAMGNPVQYILLTAIEISKMFFWESTRLGFVSYPEYLERIFCFKPFNNTLRFLTSVLTCVALIYCMYFLFRKRRTVFLKDGPDFLILLITIIILLFTVFYSLFMIIPRYILPIVPLYLIICAFFIQNELFSRKNS